MSDSALFASSIHATVEPVPGAEVSINDLSHLTKLIVKTTPSHPVGLSPAFGASELVGAAVVCGSRPGEWMIIGEGAAVAAAVSGVTAHAVDFTHGRALLEIAGPAAAGVLEKVCSLDWSDAMMPNGAVVSASVAKVSCDLIRHDRDGGPAYLVATDRSFGQYLYDALIDAAKEFNPA